MEQLIADFQAEPFRRQHRPAMLRALGSMAVGMAGNKLLPGLGGLLSMLMNLDRTVADFNFRKDSRWAAFVTDARRQLRR